MSARDGYPPSEADRPGRDTVKDFFDRIWRRIQDVFRGDRSATTP